MADIPVYESTAETVVVVTSNGQATFNFDFLILFPEQMTVLHGRGDVETVLTYPADFSVSGLDEPNGGTVALNAATLAGDVITMRRVTPIERTSDWQAEGDYKAALVNREQDTMFMIMQEISRDTGKAVDEVSLMDGRITLEQQLRIAADTALGGRVDKEISDRANAVANEAYLREAGDKSVASLIGQAGPIETQVYDTQTAAALSAVKPTIQSVRTGGFFAAGDGGGALYKRSPVEPDHEGKFQSADGAWWELAEKRVSPFMFGARQDVATSQHEALQRFFDYCHDVKVECADMIGDFWISEGITVDVGQTQLFFCNFTVRALGPIDLMLDFQNVGIAVFRGRVQALGTGSTDYTSRTCVDGISIAAASRSGFDFINADGFLNWGVRLRGGNSNIATLGLIRTRRCGSNHFANTGVGAEWSNAVNSGSSGSTNQRTTLNVSRIPPAYALADNDRTPVIVLIDGEPHRLASWDETAGTISIHPWINANATPGTLRYLFGGGIQLDGSDQNVVGIEMADSQICGHAVYDNSLYGPVIQRLVAQNVGSGYTVGQTTSDSHISTVINSLYCENHAFTAINNSNASRDIHIVAMNESLLSRVVDTNRPRLSTNNLATFNNFSGWIIGGRRNVGPSWGGAGVNTLNLFARDESKVFYKSSSNQAFAFQGPEAEENRVFGTDSGRVVVMGGGANGQVTGNITFSLGSGMASAGWTLNGDTANAVFSGMTKPADFAYIYDYISKNVRLFHLN